MAVFVDPKTGEVFDNVPDDEAERAQKEFGLVAPEAYARQKAWDEKSLGGKVEETALAGAKGLLRGGASLGMLADQIVSGSNAAQRFEQNFPGQEDPLYGKGAQELSEAHPIATGVGQSLPFMVAGGAGGLGWGMAAGAGVEGVSQEAVDSVMQKRDFSAKSALMNGGVNLAFGALGHYGVSALGKAFGAGEDVAAGAARAEAAADAAPRGRNWVAEIDPGQVPEPVSGTRRARSAGSAAAANQQYAGAARKVPDAPVNLEGRTLEDLNALPIEDAADRARVEALKADPDFASTGRVKSNDGAQGITLVDDEGELVLRDGRHRMTAAQELGRESVYGRYVDGKTGKVIYEGEIPLKQSAANDVAEPFTDDLYEAAVKDIDDAVGPNGKKGLDKEAQFLADPKTAEKLTELGASNVADTLDDARKIIRDDLSIGVKNQDARRLAKEWTPENLEAQRAWLGDTVEAEAEAIAKQIDASRAAAADVRAGRSGARAAGAEAMDAGGIDSAIRTKLAAGMDKVRRATGAQQAIAIDGLKREIGGLVRSIGKSTSVDLPTRTARSEMLQGFYTTLQEGLEDGGKYAKFAELQKATNEALTRGIEPMGRVEEILSKRLGDTWGEQGQAAINRETRAAAVQSLLRAKPAEQREFRRALSDALTAFDDLAAARQAHGVTNLGQLPRLRQGLLEIEKEFRFGRILQTAERRAGEITPGLGERLAGAGIDMVAGRIPVAGQAAAKEGKRFLESFRGAAEMPKPGTPLRSVLDERLKAYSRNVDLGDAEYSRLLPQWLQGALRGHGGQVAGVAGVGVGAAILGAPGTAGAAEMLPEQRQARDDLSAQLATLPPEEQQASLRTAEAFARIQQKTEQRVQGAVSSLFALAKDPKAPVQHRSPEARQLDRRSRELDVPRHLARFMGKEDDPVSAWQGKAEIINGVVADPTTVARTMAENLGDLPRQQPEIFGKMVAQTMATVEYLHERMPGSAGKSALDPDGYPPTFEEISEWAGHWVGALHPLDSLDDLASNELVPEQMEAVQALWPEGYAMFQSTAMKEIHSLSQKGGVIPIEALEQIDSALDLDGAGEPLLSSAYKQLLTQATAKEAEKLQAQAPQQQPPMQSQGPSRLASSSLASLHPQ